MKKLLLACLFVAGVSTLSHAQGGGGGGFQQKTPEETLASWKAPLSLTDAQSAKLMPILVAQKKSNDSMMTAMQGGGDRQAMMPVMQANRAKYTAQIKAVLTAEQATKYDALNPPRGGRPGGGGGGGGTPPPPQR